ncbi:hypothetical protein C1645_822510 [Glomus cerebriforme]|uniref:Uncharacterized protein n=1 Tax=Glomus cerebriforme TaxID=658196 RepID=A0A397T489_9GLOM|nr:hypothetical protein C1645_822510 [Glomus cerebriforme]
MINFANPELKLPSQKVLADELEVTICFDEWKNVKKQEIMESVLITSDRQVLVWGGENISRKRIQ